MANYQALLLGAQAAGIGVNLYAARSEKRAVGAGIEAERAQLSLRMEQEQLAFQEANIASLEGLAEVLSTQRAIQAARGTSTNAGSAVAISEKSIRNQSADTQARKLNKVFREQQMKGLNSLLNIKQAGAEAKFGASLIETGLSAFNLNTSIGQWLNNKTKPSKPDFVTKNKSAYSPKKQPLIIGGNY